MISEPQPRVAARHTGGEGRVLIGLLAFNESASIASTVRELRAAQPGLPVVVVDDGSGDDTAQLALSFGATVVRHAVNLGVAAGEATLLRYGLRQGFDVVVRMDGDGQHHPDSVPALVEALRGGADLVVGSRFLGPRSFESTGLRRGGIRFLSWVLASLTGWTVTDPTSGFRAFGPRALKVFSEAVLHEYPEPESLLLAARHGLKFSEIVCQMRERTAGESSITPLRSVFYMLKVCFALGLEFTRSR